MITELGVGEALVSFLDEKGRPCVVEQAFIAPPGTRVGPVTAQEREKLIRTSPVAGTYDKAEDRESAYEKLTQRVVEELPKNKPAKAQSAKPAPESSGGLMDVLTGSTGPRGGRREGAVEAAAKSAARSIGSQIGREIVRGVLGSIFGGGRRR